jgi:hypothetical protein
MISTDGLHLYGLAHHDNRLLNLPGPETAVFSC